MINSEDGTGQWFLPHAHEDMQGKHCHIVTPSAHNSSHDHGEVPSVAVAVAIRSMTENVFYGTQGPSSPASPVLVRDPWSSVVWHWGGAGPGWTPVGAPSGIPQDSPFALMFGVMLANVRKNCEDKGWYDEPVTFPESMMLLVTEVAEAVDVWRKHGFDDIGHLTGGKPEGVGSEFADVLIRLLDSCNRFGVDLFAEYQAKMTYNATRPYRHGDRPVVPRD